jgi:hypothetical protein
MHDIQKELSKMTKNKVWGDHVDLINKLPSGPVPISDVIGILNEYNTPEYRFLIRTFFEETQVEIQKEREETDIEFNRRKKEAEKRMITENEKEAIKEEKERKEFERLKKKFEGT